MESVGGEGEEEKGFKRREGEVEVRDRVGFNASEDEW